jgi:hypothetical protein
MLIKSVIKAECRRFIIVILHLTIIKIKCYILLMVSILSTFFWRIRLNRADFYMAKKNKL